MVVGCQRSLSPVVAIGRPILYDGSLLYDPSVRRWSEVAEQFAGTTRPSEKTWILPEYLQTLTPAELPVAVVFLAGRPFPERDPRTVGLGWAAIVKAAEENAD